MRLRRISVRRKSVIRMNVNKRRSARAYFGHWHLTGDVCVNVKFF
jgi:hypothetical protein